MLNTIFDTLKNFHNSTKSLRSIILFALFLFLFLFLESINGEEIRKQKLQMKLTDGKQIERETLLPGDISELNVEHITLAGPISYTEKTIENHETILIFIKGKGNLIVDNKSYTIVPETIALPFANSKVIINVSKGDTLHIVQMHKALSEQDVLDIKSYPLENRKGIYFTSFEDCEAYTEKIKSPNTVSRTVLPKDHIPRVAMGTVKTKGPDAVGAHEHPMLDQLFLGLAGSNVTVFADDASTQFKEFELLHIPIGSSHGVSVENNETMYYLWMDFFLTKQGEEWLKTHKKIKNDSDYPAKKP